MSEPLITFLTDLLVAVLIGVSGYLIALIIGRLLRKLFSKFLSTAWAGFLSNLAVLGIALMAIKIIVDQTGWAGAFVVIVTAITGAFAIGSERLAADLVAGIKLLLLHYYEVGQLVTIADQFGMVHEITLTHTILSTRQRDQVIIPNSQAVGQIVVNHSKIHGHIVKPSIPIPGEHDREKVMQIMQEAAEEFDLRLKEYPVIVLLDDFGVNTSYYQVRILVDEEAWRPVTDAKLRFAVTDALESAGVKVGIPEVVKLTK